MVLIEIEEVFYVSGRGHFVLGRRKDQPTNFWVPKHSRLGEIPIDSYCTQPRILDKTGSPRIDVFTFKLKNEEDRARLNQGQVLELFPGADLQLLEPWVTVDKKEKYEAELLIEINNRHKLWGLPIEAISRREDRDDVLFRIDESQFAVVHLTWSGCKEKSSAYPRTDIYPHWTNVFEQVIMVDHFNYYS